MEHLVYLGVGGSGVKALLSLKKTIHRNIW